MKRLVLASLLAASLFGVQTSMAQTVQTQVISRYFFVDTPAVLNTPGVLRADASNVYLDVPGAALAASDGSFYNRFVSFSMTMPREDWINFLFH